MDRTLGATLLIAGTAIGAGMLALPITTGPSGYLPSIATIILCFLYMLSSLFLLIEANLYNQQTPSNLLSLTHDTLGQYWAYFASLCFLLLLYAVASAYLAGGSSLLRISFEEMTDHTALSPLLSQLIFGSFLGCIALFGTRWVDLLNRTFMLGLIGSYLFLIVILSPHITTTHLTTSHPHFLWATIPVIILSFTSHIILPSLKSYLKHDITSLKKACLYGSCLPLIFYIIWETLVLGILPHAHLLSIVHAPQPLETLTYYVTHQGIQGLSTGNHIFSICALITSYLGVLLSLIDFLADGLRLNAQRQHARIMLTMLSILPALILIHVFPSFTELLSYAGVFVAILYGILPVLIVWRARYIHQYPQDTYRFPGGKSALIIMLILACAVIALQIMQTNHGLPNP